MGNRSTRACAVPVPVESVEICAPLENDEAPTRGLRRDVAREIALAWSEQLRGCVRLETDDAPREFKIVDSFEWVTFVFNRSLAECFKEVQDGADTAAAARAATVAWLALSCCAGYSSRENPRFWRQVFTELYYPEYPKSGVVWLEPEPGRPQHPITEAIAFFPDPEKPFPRVRIVAKSGEEVTCVLPFLSASNHGRTNAHMEKLNQILAQLRPFILQSRWSTRSIPIAVDEESAVRVTNGIQYVWRRDKNEKVAQSRDVGHLILGTIFLSPRNLSRAWHIDKILQYVGTSGVIARCDSSHLICRAGGRFSCLLADDSTHTLRIRISKVDMLPSFDNSGNPFPRIFSVLPHSQSVTAIRLVHDTLRMEQLSDSDWTWLGYAVFHPEAAHKTAFTDLELDLNHVPVVKIKIFASMAKGNNIQAESGVVVASTNTTYEWARIRAGTVVSSNPHAGADVLWSFPCETSITLCITTGTHLIGEWVRAVIPGVGLGWIESHRILEITSRSPGPSCLKALRLTIRDANDCYASMLTLLSAVGGGLRHLDIESSTLLDTEQVLSVLRLCPSLVSLQIGHDGACWADAKLYKQLPQLPRLQQLELRLKSTGINDPAALKPLCSNHLDDLVAFRVSTLSHGSFSTNRKAFLAVLARYPRIQYAYHTIGNAPHLSWEFKSYGEHRAGMLSRLGQIQAGLHDVWHGPMQLHSRLAFLSVIHHAWSAEEKSQWLCLQRIGPDIVRNIFSFSTSIVKRDLYVD